MNEDKNIEFVAKHYRTSKFNADRGWKRLGISRRFWNWKRVSAAAAVGVVVVSAAAFAVYENYYVDTPSQQEVTPNTVAPAYMIKAIDFENAPLPKVIESIENTYEVKIINIPDDATDFNLSLHYEGNAFELVETINDILDINLKIEE
ncbi:MAG: hypothetical protein NC095_07115 [Muribaculum sp.]|nr:hypothetical protein [Muribaculum sp.]